MSINTVTLSGNLTRDPEIRQLPSGTSICSMRVAVNERVKDSNSGEWTDRANYFNITMWGARGEACGRFLNKGSRIMVSGRLRWNEWKAQDGSNRQDVEIVADNIVFPPRNEDGGGARSDSGGSFGTPQGSGSLGTPMPATPTAADDQDDIPFMWCDHFDVQSL